MKHNKNKGFSLVELIVVIAIMAILIGVAVPVYSAYVDKSRMRKDIALVDEITHALQIAHGSGEIKIAGNAAGLDVPVGYIVVGKNPVDGTDYIKTVVEEGATDTLHTALVTALGEDYTSLSLSYDDWNAVAGDMFFTNAPDMVQDIYSDGATTLAWMNGLKSLGLYEDGTIKISLFGEVLLEKQMLSKHYNDAGELMLAMANKLANENVQSQMIADWTTPRSGASYGFDSKEREFFSATRLSYNHCLANYINANADKYTHTGGTASAHADAIKTHSDTAAELIVGDRDIPSLAQSLVNSALKGAPTYPRNFTPVDTECQACKDLIAEYTTSGQAESDANNFIKTMTTGNTTGRDIYTTAGGGTAGTNALVNWMKGTAERISELNAKLEGYVADDNSVIVISVLLRDGRLEFDYSPALDQ